MPTETSTSSLGTPFGTLDITIRHGQVDQQSESDNGQTSTAEQHETGDIAEPTSTNTDTTRIADPDVEDGSIGAYFTIYQVKDGDDFTWVSEEPKDAVEAAENDETAKFAVILRSMKSSDSRKKYEAHSIIVQSAQLKHALGEILKDYPGISCDLERLEFETPFKPFMHRWSDLQAYMERDLDQTTREHMTMLNNLLQQELRDEIKAYKDYISKGVTTFDHAWMLFQPGGVFLSQSHGPVSAYELVDASYSITDTGRKLLSLTADVVEWNGTEFGRYEVYICIPEFKGSEKITNLAAFPMSFHPEMESIKATLVERGRKFEALAGSHFRSYTGVAIDWDHQSREVQLYHDGRIIVDCDAFNRWAPWSGRGIKDFTNRDEEQLIRKQQEPRPVDVSKQVDSNENGSAFILSDYFRMLCYSRTRGYSVVLKKWLDFYVSNIQPITWNTRAFDALVLPEDQKELILAFAESQIQSRSSFDDTIVGKGQGIIILLSGKPGVGKTLTAESVAEAMSRPLYPISSGDLGSSAWDIEEKLRMILDMVGRWNAVLLLDECDVFLEARSNHDLERNALVSTFLRTLEYYTGILFLTTNRVDNIDPAFESRIHVSMQYPDLNLASRRKIWTTFLVDQKHCLKSSEIDTLAALNLNGRQIKNILKTSILLANHKKRDLSMKELDVVLDIERKRPEKRLQDK